MSDQNKTTRKIEEAPKSAGSSSPAKPSGMKKFFSKRWVFPAAYMAAAAIIVTILWLNAGGSGTKEPQDAAPGLSGVETQDAGSSPEALEAAASGESLEWPFVSSGDLSVSLPFYDANASEDKKAAAMVEYNNSFTPHTAIDFARKDQKAFEVRAAMSGKVTVAEQTPTNGYEVQIDHGNGLVTVYQSLDDLKVKQGDEVKQGDVLAMAGRSEMEQNEGVHVHFEVRNNGQSVDPNSLIKAQ
ncbi:M23 family metallopeptidase [Cohnella zeiphila]|uniref:M23 family metallopeptidase n=1 Tax=Cohnella zeiphila TaxID=2761120 RepID=A0A7X0VW99_9BACL|nr:M23 family metallopeptidase [Cohnella zeiphila]MBB6732969.1 M23 family metallopeptidase [Cohnella zeiphila]